MFSLSFPNAKKLVWDGFCKNRSILVLALGDGDNDFIDKLLNNEDCILGAANSTEGLTIDAIGVEVGVITGASGYSSSLASDSVR